MRLGGPSRAHPWGQMYEPRRGSCGATNATLHRAVEADAHDERGRLECRGRGEHVRRPCEGMAVCEDGERVDAAECGRVRDEALLAVVLAHLARMDERAARVEQILVYGHQLAGSGGEDDALRRQAGGGEGHPHCGYARAKRVCLQEAVP